MKRFLIILNILLILGICHGLHLLFISGSTGEDPYFFKEKKKSTFSPEPEKVQAPAQEKYTDEQKRSIIVKQNIFNPERCPNARVFGRNRNNAKVSMTLVGTFEIGELKGAIILQKQQQQNNFPFPGMMPPPMMGGPQMNNNQQNGRRNGNQVNRFRPPMMGGPPGMMGNNNNQQNKTENLVYQQYVRVGETMANGYTLLSVTRSTASLKKGSEKLELTIVEASENAGAKNKTSDNRNNRNNRQGGFMPGMMGGPPGMMGGGPPGMMGGGPPGMMGGGPPGMGGGFNGNNNGSRRGRNGNR